jgi:hypothetical protein
MQDQSGDREFDIALFFAAIDERRRRAGLSWSRVATQIWQLAADLNAKRGSHPLAASTITNMSRRGDTTCQHAAAMLRWLEQPPEEFIASPCPGTAGVRLPEADAAHRLRWNLVALYAALNATRLERRASWVQMAQGLHCSANQLTGLRTAKYATGMRLAMRICQDLGRPAATFIYAAEW